jgi:TolB-like protein
MADLFLSYARADRDIAERIAGALTSAGYSVWWDRNLVGGTEFAVDIERELASCEVVLVVWSAAASESPWVKDEAAVGREAGKLVALALDTKPPPLGFRQYHAIDFSGWNGSGEAPEFEGLIRAVEARRRGDTPAVPEVTESAPRRRPASSRPKSRLWVLAALVLAVAGLFSVQLMRDGDDASSSRSDTGAPPRVAVTALKARGDADLDEFAAALTESIANGLSRFPHLYVSVRKGASEGGAEAATYELDGSLVRSGSTLRLTVALIKTGSGEQAWGETYDRNLEANSRLAVQDDLTASVVASVADSYGALMRDLSARVAEKPPNSMSPYEAVLRHLVYRQRLGSEEHAQSRAALEQAVTSAPNDTNVQAALAAVYTDEYKHSYNPRPGSLDRALEVARRAVALDPDNAYAHFVLAETNYFRQDLGAFRAAAERAMALNPYDSDAMAMIGILSCYGGRWEEGVALTERAMALNPNHPGWYRFGIAFDQLRRQDYAAALETAQRINLPLYFADPYVRTVAHAYLGHTRQARDALAEFVTLWPREDFGAFQETHLERWFYATPELTRLTLEGLKRAGLEWDETAGPE